MAESVGLATNKLMAIRYDIAELNADKDRRIERIHEILMDLVDWLDEYVKA